MIPIGTTVYSFRDYPFIILEGKVLEYRIVNKEKWCICEWFDPILGHAYIETSFSPYLTKKEAKKAHIEICKILFKHRTKKVI